MDFNYFVTDGVMRFKRLPSPKATVKIKDYTDLETLRDLIKGADTEYKIKQYHEYFSYLGAYEVDVESFSEYFDRNPKKFLEKLNGLKGYYDLIEELLYWADDYYWEEPRDITKWEILFSENKEYTTPRSQEDKLFMKLEKFDIIEMKKSSEKSDLIKYIQSGITVAELKIIATNNNIVISGKKDDKINQLVQAIENALVNELSVVMYRPGKGFKKWFDELQIKYVNEVEYAISTFDYPEFYTATIWDEALNVNNEFSVILDTINTRHKVFCDKALSKVEDIADKFHKLPLDAPLSDFGIDINIEYYDSSENDERQGITKLGNANITHKNISTKRAKSIIKEKNTISSKTFIATISLIMIIAIATDNFIAGIVISLFVSLILVKNMPDN